MPIIRNVVVHINNEQPIIVDLMAEPTPSDVALVCRNVRSLAGKKPIFVNAPDSTFVIPLAHVHVVELPQASLEAFAAESAAQSAQATEAAEAARTEAAGAEAARTEAARTEAARTEAARTEAARTEAAGVESEYSGFPLARRAWPTGDGEDPWVAAAKTPTGDGPEGGPANPDGLDDDLMRRIREA
jgi:hypothetical protein